MTYTKVGNAGMGQLQSSGSKQLSERGNKLLVSCPSHNIMSRDPSDNHETESGGAGDHGRTAERAEQAGAVAHVARR
jgi:hypothetical protein